MNPDSCFLQRCDEKHSVATPGLSWKDYRGGLAYGGHRKENLCTTVILMSKGNYNERMTFIISKCRLQSQTVFSCATQ